MSWKSVVVCIALVACKEHKQSGRVEEKPPSAAPAAPAPTPPAPDAAAPAPKPEAAEQQVEVSFMGGDKRIPVTARVPVGWIRRDGISTWDPPDARQLPDWHRAYEITATCDGGCTPAELEAKLPRYLDGVIAHHKKPNMSGDPAKDAVTEARVKELERGTLPQGGAYVLARVEKPLTALKDPYPDIFSGVCVTRGPNDEFMIVTRIAGAPDDEHTWWPVLVEACKATKVIGAK